MAADTLSKSAVSFSHVHMYCDSLQDLAEYKKMEKKLNAFVSGSRGAIAPPGASATADVAAGRKGWVGLAGPHGHPVTGDCDPSKYNPTGQDVVSQMVTALGWRITGSCESGGTRSLVVTSVDPNGVKFVISADSSMRMDAMEGLESASKRARKDAPFHHFDASKIERFAREKRGRQGVAVLGFDVKRGCLDAIVDKYKTKHPKLVVPNMPAKYSDARVFEVWAYYKGEKIVSDAEHGTILRFVEQSASARADTFWVLPGVERCEAAFDPLSVPAYCDHWVSNVISRQGFLDTLEDTLGFTPKVDFNAGVVAAGEAQIESTVTGNDPGVLLNDEKVALKDQSQVYLPINNALSEVGHVHLYLKEIGQGIQHIASRVCDLPSFIQRANDYREMTGAGLTWLNIPRSYYGALTAKTLSRDAGIAFDVAEKHVKVLRQAGIVDSSDNTKMDTTLDEVGKAIPGVADAVRKAVMRSRYNNLYSLLQDHVSEDTYLKIVRNKVLVDVQGNDLLLQIFSSMVLQRVAGQEAPFLEFIQRVCSEKVDANGKPKPMKPGCGGFGIRNFLTLFLCIEVSKASKGRADAEAAGKPEHAKYYGSMVAAFTQQLDESNPVLTAISDAMTAEGEALEKGDKGAAAKQSALKEKGQEGLQVISLKYKAIMKGLREKAPVGA